MHIIYPDTPERPAFFINPHKMNPVKAWLKHYSNFKYLQLIHDSPKTAPWERRQANKEIQTATKKMDYWHKMFKDMPVQIKELEEGKAAIDKQWSSK